MKNNTWETLQYSKNQVKKAYPNYFADTNYFIKNLKKIINDNKR